MEAPSFSNFLEVAIGRLCVEYCVACRDRPHNCVGLKLALSNNFSFLILSKAVTCSCSSTSIQIRKTQMDSWRPFKSCMGTVNTPSELYKYARILKHMIGKCVRNEGYKGCCIKGFWSNLLFNCSLNNLSVEVKMSIEDHYNQSVRLSLYDVWMARRSKYVWTLYGSLSRAEFTEIERPKMKPTTPIDKRATHPQERSRWR